jgi:hypothetical protein
MKTTNGNYRYLEQALERGLQETYGGQHRVVINVFRQEHSCNPFCLTYPLQIVIYVKGASLTDKLSPQEDLFAPKNGHSDNLTPLPNAKADGVIEQKNEPRENDHVEA